MANTNTAQDLVTVAASYDSAAVAKTLRSLLKTRTGRAWSVRKGAGTSSQWITVRATNGRLEDGRMSDADLATLTDLFGREAHRDGLLIRPGKGIQAWFLCSAAGLELPEGTHIASPDWD